MPPLTQQLLQYTTPAHHGSTRIREAGLPPPDQGLRGMRSSRSHTLQIRYASKNRLQLQDVSSAWLAYGIDPILSR